MKLIVGLGNPGSDYAHHRHTVGFWVIHKLAQIHGCNRTTKRQRGCDLCETFVLNKRVLLIKPLLYMNDSGKPVHTVMKFYKIPSNYLLVIHDELDFAFGKYALKYGGSSAGHKGIQNIIDTIGTKDFWRLRIGIGRPDPDSGQSVSDYVLSNFTHQEMHILQEKAPLFLQKIMEFISLH